MEAAPARSWALLCVQRSQLSPIFRPHQRPRPKVSPARVNQKANMASGEDPVVVDPGVGVRAGFCTEGELGQVQQGGGHRGELEAATGDQGHADG